MKSAPDPLAALDALPRELLPAALARLAARLLTPPKAAPTADAGQFLTPDEVAARLGVHRRRVYQLAKQLGAVKLGRRTLRVPAAGLAAYLERPGEDPERSDLERSTARRRSGQRRRPIGALRGS